MIHGRNEGAKSGGRIFPTHFGESLNLSVFFSDVE